MGLGRVEDTPQRILDVVATYGRDLCILAISPLTPLAAAVKLDTEGILRTVRRIYFQGNVMIDPVNNSLVPGEKAYNFRTDVEAAKLVFSELQQHVPFTFLGKFAAYKVSVTRTDLEKLNQDKLPSMALMARDQMNAFRQGSPEL